MDKQNVVYITLQKTTDFIKANKKQIMMYGGIVLLVMIGLSFYLKYRQGKEKDLSMQLNLFFREYLMLDQKEEKSFTEEQRQQALYTSIHDMYLNNKSYKNGKRALFFTAELDFRAGKLAEAYDKFTTVYRNKRHLLAPQALMYAALCKEEEGDFKEAINLLELYESRYLMHYSYGEAMLSLARNYLLTQDIDKAAQLYKKLSENPDLGNYKDDAAMHLKILAMKYQNAGIQQNAMPAGPVQSQPVLTMPEGN
jgi:tetratricopeptide (TPR) repeat protein